MPRVMTRGDRVIYSAILLVFRALGGLSAPSRERLSQGLGRLLFRLDP